MPESAFRWSQTAEEWAYNQGEQNLSPGCDVLVIGSGYGGSFAARELARAGRQVWLFERGREHPLGSFPNHLGDLPGHIRFQRETDAEPIGKSDAVLDFRIYQNLSVLVANGLGGGSLINAGVAVPPEAGLFRDPRWPSHYRDYPEHQQVLFQTMTEIQRLLQAKPFDGAQELKKFQTLRHLGQSMQCGIDALPITVATHDQISPAGVKQKACTRCGNCFTGCNVGAKNTLTTHVLPDAVRAGALLVTGLTAVEIAPCQEVAPSGMPYRWRVRVALTDPDALPTGPRREWWVRARTLVLSAGALGSTELLLRSQRQVKTSRALGKRFSTNGDALVMGWAMDGRVNGMAHLDEEEKPLHDRVGPTITGRLSPTIEVQGQKQQVLVEEGAVPSALTRAVVALASTMALPYRYTRSGSLEPHIAALGGSTDPLATPADLDRHALLLLVMGADAADGRIELDAIEGSDQKSLRIRWDKEDGPRSSYYQTVHDWLKQALAQGGFQGGDYLPSPLWKPVPDEFAGVAPGLDAAMGLSVHPLGGCSMGDSSDTGVVDWRGAVFKREGGVHEGLYVLDGAILPTAVGVNPFLAIAGLSLVAVRALVLSEAAGFVASPPCPRLPWPIKQPQMLKRHPVQADQRVRLQFCEHLQGHWVGSKPAWVPPTPPEWSREERKREWIVAVDVELDLDAWLTNPSMRLTGSRMRIFHNPHPHQLSVPQDIDLATPWLEGEGWISLLAHDPPADPWALLSRRLMAVFAFAVRRPWADVFNGDRRQTWKKRIGSFWRTASHHAHYRSLDYSFELSSVLPDVPIVHATGRKLLAYAPFEANPWDALTQMNLQLQPVRSAKSTTACLPIGTLALTVDLIDLMRHQRLQVAQASNTSVAVVGLAMFVAMWLRALFQTHFWSLRGVNYHQLQVPKPAEHGVLKLRGKSCKPEVIFLQVPRTQEDDISESIRLELTRYIPPSGDDPDRQLLMIHGLAHGATVFTTDTIENRNMATAFLADGYTVWLLDHRLSNRLGYATQKHTVDDVGALDIPTAVHYVYQSVGQRSITVLAHCVGAAAFEMAVLKGKLHDKVQGNSMVKAAIIHAVHPWVVPSASNQFSGELATLYRDWIPTGWTVNPIPPQKPDGRDQVLDRIASSLPWPDHELRHHWKHRTDKSAGTATCNRMTLFYGQEWVHANLADATHRELASLVGSASIEVFQQLYYIVNRQRLTDREGTDVYMTQAQFHNYWSFPVLFCHGSENKVFDPRSAVRSWRQLRRLQAKHPHQAQRRVALFIANGYGHMDFLFGRSAYKDVYPALINFANSPHTFNSSFSADIDDLALAHQSIPRHWQDHSDDEALKPLTGPMLQCQHVFDQSAPPQGWRELVVWVELPNDPWLDAPVPWLTNADDGLGQPIPNVQVIPLLGVHDHSLEQASMHQEKQWRVSLLDGPGRYWVLRLRENQDFHLADIPNLCLRWGSVKKETSSEQTIHTHVGEVFLRLADYPWWETWTAEQSAGELSPVPVSWLATSCRWPGVPMERRAIDQLALQMRKHVSTTDHPAQALVLLGDQIYADATGNVLNIPEGDERLAQMYREAWGGWPETRSLLASIPTYFAVDDHEYTDNWHGAADPVTDDSFLNGFEAALAYQWRWTDSHHHEPKVYAKDIPRSAHQIPTAGADVRGFWSEFEIAHIPAFAMDTRSERPFRPPAPAETPPHHPVDVPWSQTPIVSEAQMHAVEQWLLLHRNELKVLCMGSVLGWVERDLLTAPRRCALSDDWAAYPASWRRLVQFMVLHQVQHTIFLTGDYHFSGVAELKLEADVGAPIRALSVVCSGWNSTFPFANASPQDFVLESLAEMPFSDHQARLVSTAYSLGTALRQFSKLTVFPASDGQGYLLHITVFDEHGHAIGHGHSAF